MAKKNNNKKENEIKKEDLKNIVEEVKEETNNVVEGVEENEAHKENPEHDTKNNESNDNDIVNDDSKKNGEDKEKKNNGKEKSLDKEIEKAVKNGEFDLDKLDNETKEQIRTLERMINLCICNIDEKNENLNKLSIFDYLNLPVKVKIEDKVKEDNKITVGEFVKRIKEQKEKNLGLKNILEEKNFDLIMIRIVEAITLYTNVFKPMDLIMIEIFKNEKISEIFPSKEFSDYLNSKFEGFDKLTEKELGVFVKEGNENYLLTLALAFIKCDELLISYGDRLKNENDSIYFDIKFKNIVNIFNLNMSIIGEAINNYIEKNKEDVEEEK